MRENWSLTNPARCDNIGHARCKTEIGRARFYFDLVPGTITNQIVGNQARAYHGGVVNHFGCAPSVASGNDNQRDGAGLITFCPANKAALASAQTLSQSLTTGNGGPNPMAKVHNTTPQDAVPNSPTNGSSKTPSHEDFINSITSHTPPQARMRLANETRRLLAAGRLRPADYLDDNDAETLQREIAQALPHIHPDDLFSLAILCYRFALCPPEARAWRGEVA